jgi:hypothetical protein
MTDSPPSSAQIDLRPLTTSELIDRGFTLYRAHFAELLLLALLCQAAPLLMSEALITALRLDSSLEYTFDKPGVIFSQIAVMVVTTVVTFCFEVVITFYIADAYLGKTPSVKESLRKFTRCVVSSVWTSLLKLVLVGLTFLFPFLAGMAVYFYALFNPPANFIALLLFFVAAFLLIFASLIPVLVVFMRLWLTVTTLALEGLSGWKAIKRSAILVRYDPGLGILYWGEMRLSFLLLPLFVIELLILSVTSLPVTLHQLGSFLQHGSGGQMAAPPDSTLILSQILTFLAVSVILPLYSIATTLFYYDIRIRREGFDLEFMAGKLEGNK